MVNNFRNKAAVALCALAASIVSTGAGAVATVSTPAGPIRVQNFPGGGTALYFTPSPCASGLLTFDPADSADRGKLLLATVLAAKAMKADLYLAYDVGSVDGAPVCYLRSFGVDGP